MADEPAARKLLAFIQQHPTGVGQKELEKSFGPIKNHMKAIRSLIDAKVIVPYKLASGEISFKAFSERMANKMGTLSPEDEQVLKAIREAGDVGIWTRTIKSYTKLQVAAMNKALKRLEGKKLIKSVKSVTFKSRKIYMLYELVPSAQVTGGAWYTDGELDTHFINSLRRSVAQFLQPAGSMKTRAEIAEHIRKSGVSKIPLGTDDVQQVIDSLVMDRAVAAMPPKHAGGGAADISAGAGLGIPDDGPAAGGAASGASSSSSSSSGRAGKGASAASSGERKAGESALSADVRRAIAQEKMMQSTVRYKRIRKKLPAPALTSVPCGMCPVAEDCFPGSSKVSPETCVYYTKWLEAF